MELICLHGCRSFSIPSSRVGKLVKHASSDLSTAGQIIFLIQKSDMRNRKQKILYPTHVSPKYAKTYL